MWIHFRDDAYDADGDGDSIGNGDGNDTEST